MRILAIDPGNIESAYVAIDAGTRRPLDVGKVPNEELLSKLWGSTKTGWLDPCEPIYIEMIGHYGTGMPAGKTVFDTCVWIGRFIEASGSDQAHGDHAELILRPTVKAHLCGSAKAKDANVAQALVDRFAPGQPNHGKGTKASPGFFFGFRADIWQAMALAVYAADQLEAEEVA